ncbi:metalloregulator ArsR/SmtB family transcription factor [Planctomycetota bacterium]|nr:metalloregulator ArsR/SmtB family transcription factor [Planctomycetota bacterium]
MKDLAEVFKALSDETRLEILALLLSKPEVCGCEFEGALGITQSKASRHLRYLLNAGLVEGERRGVWVHYRIPKNLDDERKAITSMFKKLVSGDRLQELTDKYETYQQSCC